MNEAMIAEREDGVRQQSAESRSHVALSEAEFTEQLAYERKRAERSGRTIALILIRSAELVIRSEGQDHALRELMSVLCSCMRDTDILGFHSSHRAGVIVSEFGRFDPVRAAGRIKERIAAAVRSRLSDARARALHFDVRLFPDRQAMSGSAGKVDLTFYPEVSGGDDRHPDYQTLKRILDLTISVISLVCLAPFLAAIALAVRITSRGPALYLQERIGQYGKPFTMLKFRTMRSGAKESFHQAYVKDYISGIADPGKSGIYKLTNDPRVTILGKFLRKTSMDELPQLVNVLKGEMSLVGPRPPLSYEVEAYEPWHRRRILEAKPGVTGLWQATARSKARFDEMVRLDIRYASRKSVWFDLSLILKTFRVLVTNGHAC